MSKTQMKSTKQCETKDTCVKKQLTKTLTTSRKKQEQQKKSKNIDHDRNENLNDDMHEKKMAHLNKTRKSFCVSIDKMKHMKTNERKRKKNDKNPEMFI